jgi:hypothetical protein
MGVLTEGLRHELQLVAEAVQLQRWNHFMSISLRDIDNACLVGPK